MKDETKHKNPKYQDLEERTLNFAKSIRNFVRTLPRNIYYLDDIRQVIRSSGSIGANYIEANNSLGNKDFMLRIRIAKKEAQETLFWLQLLKTNNDDIETQRKLLIGEVTELMKILGAILSKYKNNFKVK